MSKYGKKLKDKEWRNQVRRVNRQFTTVRQESVMDKRSTRKTFDRWCEECGDQLGEYSGVLSIAGSDGIRLTDTKVGKADFNYPEDVDSELEKEGYYEETDVNMGTYHYHPPKMKYSDWFYNVYLNN